MQFRPGGSAGTAYNTYTILQVIGSNQLLLDSPYTGPVQTAIPYTVFQCYVPMPQDFESWISLYNITSNYQLHTNVQQSDLDRVDAQRVQMGISFGASFYDFQQSFQGVVGPTIQVSGSGSQAPQFSAPTGYTYPANSVFSVVIVQSGATGTATYVWSQNGQPYSTPITTTTYPYNLGFGVSVYFPATGNYLNGQIFVVQCTVDETATTGIARYEFWPRPINTPTVYGAAYRRVFKDLSDLNPVLPAQLANRGDILLEMALENCALWPGTETRRNPYYSLQQAEYHRKRSLELIDNFTLLDDDLNPIDVGRSYWDWAPAPWFDGSWNQSHAVYGGLG